MNLPTLPADSRQFHIMFPVPNPNDSETEYRKARDLADHYSVKARTIPDCAAILVKFDISLQCYYWMPHPKHPDSREVWRRIVDIYEPVPLTFEQDDKPGAHVVVPTGPAKQGTFQLFEEPFVTREEVQELERRFKASQNENIRTRIKRQVGVASRSRGMGFEEVYIIAYGLFYNKTKVHPAVESARTGKAAHLDVVFEVENGPAILLECINAIILNGRPQ